MEIHVRLYGVLRETLPPEARGRTTVTLQAGSTVGDLLAALNLSRGNIVVAVNDEHQVDEGRPLAPGDRVSIFTVIGGGGMPAAAPA